MEGHKAVVLVVGKGRNPSPENERKQWNVTNKTRRGISKGSTQS